MSCKVVLFAFHNAGCRCLQWLHDQDGFDVPLVVTHRPYAGENVWFESAEGLAGELGIRLLFHEETDNERLREEIEHIAPDILFTINYRKILPPEIFRLARIGAFNIHDSLLPAYRGFAPAVWAIIRGETKTGVTIHELAEEVDAGDIISQAEVPISPDDRIGDLLPKLIDSSVELFTQILPRIANGSYERRPQALDEGFFMPRRSAKDDYIDWSKSAEEIRNFVRAVSPPIAFARTRVTDRELRVDDVLAHEDASVPKNAAPGTVLAVMPGPQLHVRAGKGLVEIVKFAPFDSNNGSLAREIEPGMRLQ